MLHHKGLEPVTALGGKPAPEGLIKLGSTINPQNGRAQGKGQAPSDRNGATVPAVRWHPRHARANTARPTRADLHETIMQFAFLRALRRWAAHHSNNSTTMTIPTGRVGAAELARVVCALAKIKT